MTIKDLKAYEKNAKKHPKKQIKQIADSIKQFGFNVPVIIDKDNVVIAGHGRLLAAEHLGMTEVKLGAARAEKGANFVPVIKAEDLTKEEVMAYRLADNKLNESDWDMKLVLEELKELPMELMELTGFEKDLILEPDEKDDEIPEDVPPVAKLGDIWQLGRHRLMCGDSTKKEDVEKLMNGNKADMVFTDPPYGMNLTPKKNYASRKENNKSENYDKIIGDSEKFDASVIFNTIDAPVYYIWGADYFPDTIPRYFEGSLIVWTKRMTEEESDKVFGSAFEICWRFPKRKKIVWFERGINQSSEALSSHPTQKPTSLATRAFKDSGNEGDLIVDLFGGSGSTLIACEKTNRICYMSELDPKYCDVIIKRWEDYTGKKATKL